MVEIVSQVNEYLNKLCIEDDTYCNAFDNGIIIEMNNLNCDNSNNSGVKFGKIDSSDEEDTCGSNFSASFSGEDKFDWDDCENTSNTNDGFILSEDAKKEEDVGEYREDIESYSVSSSEGKQIENDMHDFKSLISHWKAKEKKWKDEKK